MSKDDVLYDRGTRRFLSGREASRVQGNQVPFSCDVVVIGSGIAGLTAAAILSKAGLDTAIFETQPRAGGYLSGFKRNGFIFDTAIQWLNQCQPGGFVYRLLHYLGDDFPKCKPLTRLRRYKGDSFDYLLTTNPLKLRDQLIEDFPDDANSITRFFKDIEVLGARLKVMNDKMRAMETMSLFEKVVYGLKMLHWVLPVWKHLRISTEKGLKRYFNSRGIQNLFCSEETFMSVVMPIGWVFTEDFRAPPKGGSQAFISWLCKNIESAGSKIFLNHLVKKVLLNDRDNAIGVLLEKGNSINSRYVLAACDVQTLYDEMVPGERIPEQLRKVLRDADLYYSNFSIFIGLDCDTTSLGFNEEVLCLTRDDVSQKDHSGGNPHKTSLIIIAPSVRDPSLAPKGKGMITIHCPAYMDYEDNWKTDEGLKRGEAYRILKREFADILIDRVENTFAPGLRKHIEVMEIATPVTYWRYTGNRKGSIMGASPTNKNIRAKLAHYRTPIKNLLLAGHWAEYGGGVPIAMRAGTNTSLMVLKDMNRAEYEKLKTVMDGKG